MPQDDEEDDEEDEEDEEEEEEAPSPAKTKKRSRSSSGEKQLEKETGKYAPLLENPRTTGQEAGSTLFFPTQERFHTVVLQGVGNISDTLWKPPVKFLL